MKKSLTVILTVFLAISFLAVSSQYVAAKPIKWKVVTTWTPAITLIKADEYFVKLANEICKGELEMKLYSAGQLVSSFEVFDAVRSGTVQAGFDWPGYWAGKNTAFGAIGGLPAGPNQMDLLTWALRGGGDEIAAEVYGKYGMMYLYTNLISCESGLRGNKAFVKKSDFKGAKIRMSGMIQGKVLKDLGAAQVMVSGQEIYQGLEKGVIDAAEFSTPDNDWSLGFQEVTSVWNVPGWHQPASICGIMINKKAWNALPPNVQRKLKIVADATLAKNMAYYNYASGIYAKKFIDKGIKVETLDDSTLKEIQGYAYKHIVEEAKKNPLFAKVALSLFDTARVISYWRPAEVSMLKRKIELPDMDALQKAAEKAK